MGYRLLHAFSLKGGPRPPLRLTKGGPSVAKAGPKIIKDCIYLFRYCFGDFKQ